MRRVAPLGVIIVLVVIGRMSTSPENLDGGASQTPESTVSSVDPSGGGPTGAGSLRTDLAPVTGIEPPPGVENGGVTNRTRLVSAHRGALLRAGFVDRLRISTLRRGEPIWVYEVTSRIAAGRSAYHQISRQVTNTELQWRRAAWSNG